MKLNSLKLLVDRSAAYLQRQRKAMQSRLHSRPFTGDTKRRILLLTIAERIPQSQIYPFHYYADAIRDGCDAEIREVTVESYLAGPWPGLDNATSVCFQTNFDVSEAELHALLVTIRARNPDAQLVYLDWFAPTDLRLAQRLAEHVSVYVKKHVLADTANYGQPTLGDTNLTDHFSRRFELNMPETQFPIPPGFLDKLLVGPSFVTADFMLGTFAGPAPLGGADRPIDIHARLAVEGTNWYQPMRAECIAAVQALNGVEVLTENGVGLTRYLQELRHSKICFSPFGYGEVCWRDFEAVANGAVLLKPDMSHIRTDPDIFIAGETYMPVAWDLSDFEDKVHLLLEDTALRKQLTENAFAVLHDYVVQGKFVKQMKPIFR
jgi:hypothetical protein